MSDIAPPVITPTDSTIPPDTYSVSEWLSQIAQSVQVVSATDYNQPAHPMLAGLYADERFHRQVVLPGAKRAICADEAGTPGIVELVNNQFVIDNQARERETSIWIDNYHKTINEIRERSLMRQALLARLEAQ